MDPGLEAFLIGHGVEISAKPIQTGRSAWAHAIDAEVLAIITESYKEAKRLRGVHRKQLEALAQGLLAQETLNEEEILAVTGLGVAPAVPAAKAELADILPAGRSGAQAEG